jgi:hypothetical protein
MQYYIYDYVLGCSKYAPGSSCSATATAFHRPSSSFYFSFSPAEYRPTSCSKRRSIRTGRQWPKASYASAIFPPTFHAIWYVFNLLSGY